MDLCHSKVSYDLETSWPRGINSGRIPDTKKEMLSIQALGYIDTFAVTKCDFHLSVRKIHN